MCQFSRTAEQTARRLVDTPGRLRIVDSGDSSWHFVFPPLPTHFVDSGVARDEEWEDEDSSVFPACLQLETRVNWGALYMQHLNVNCCGRQGMTRVPHLRGGSAK